MKINLLYLDNGTIKEIQWAQLDSDAIEAYPVPFGSYPIGMPQTDEEAQANAILMNTLPAKSAPLWFHAVPETGEDNFKIYMSMGFFSGNFSTDLALNDMKLYKGYSTEVPTDITIMPSNKVEITSDMITTAWENIDSKDTGLIEIANSDWPYGAWQLEITAKAFAPKYVQAKIKAVIIK